MRLQHSCHLLCWVPRRKIVDYESQVVQNSSVSRLCDDPAMRLNNRLSFSRKLDFGALTSREHKRVIVIFFVAAPTTMSRHFLSHAEVRISFFGSVVVLTLNNLSPSNCCIYLWLKGELFRLLRLPELFLFRNPSSHKLLFLPLVRMFYRRYR